MFVGLELCFFRGGLWGTTEHCEKKDAEKIISIEDSIVKTRLYLDNCRSDLADRKHEEGGPSWNYNF
jgi:hypothetical protein